MTGCVDPFCTTPRSQTVRRYTTYPSWLLLPDRIVEHCECGRHRRTWTTSAFLNVWRDHRAAA